MKQTSPIRIAPEDVKTVDLEQEDTRKENSEDIKPILDILNDIMNILGNILRVCSIESEIRNDITQLNTFLLEIIPQFKNKLVTEKEIKFFDNSRAFLTLLAAEIQRTPNETDNILETSFETLQGSILSSNNEVMTLYEHQEILFVNYDKFRKKHAYSRELIHSFEAIRCILKTIDPLKLLVQPNLCELKESILSVNEKISNVKTENLTITERRAMDCMSTTTKNLQCYLENILKEKDGFSSTDDVKASIENLRLLILSLDDNNYIKEVFESFEETVKNIVNILENIPTENYAKIKNSTMETLLKTQTMINSFDSSKFTKRKRRCILSEVLKNLNEVNEIVFSVVCGGENECFCFSRLDEILQEVCYLMETTQDQHTASIFEKLDLKVEEFKTVVNNVSTTSKICNIQHFIPNITDGIKAFIASLDDGSDDIDSELINLRRVLVSLRNSLPSDDNKIMKELLIELHLGLTTLQFVVTSLLEDEKKTLRADEIQIVRCVSDALEKLNPLLSIPLSEFTMEHTSILECVIEELKKAPESINGESPTKDLIDPLQEISIKLNRAYEKLRRTLEETRKFKLKFVHNSISAISKLAVNFETWSRTENLETDIFRNLQSCMNEISSSLEHLDLEKVSLRQMESLNRICHAVQEIQPQYDNILELETNVVTLNDAFLDCFNSFQRFPYDDCTLRKLFESLDRAKSRFLEALLYLEKNRQRIRDENLEDKNLTDLEPSPEELAKQSTRQTETDSKSLTAIEENIPRTLMSGGINLEYTKSVEEQILQLPVEEITEMESTESYLLECAQKPIEEHHAIDSLQLQGKLPLLLSSQENYLENVELSEQQLPGPSKEDSEKYQSFPEKVTHLPMSINNREEDVEGTESRENMDQMKKVDDELINQHLLENTLDECQEVENTQSLEDEISPSITGEKQLQSAEGFEDEITEKLFMNLKRLQNFVGRIIQTSCSDLDILAFMGLPLHQLIEDIAKEGTICEDTREIISSLNISFSEIITLCEKEDCKFEDFTKSLYSLENVLISACLKAVLKDESTDRKTLIQNILPSLDALAKAVINMQTEYKIRIQLRKGLETLLEDLNHFLALLDNIPQQLNSLRALEKPFRALSEFIDQEKEVFNMKQYQRIVSHFANLQETLRKLQKDTIILENICLVHVINSLENSCTFLAENTENSEVLQAIQKLSSNIRETMEIMRKFDLLTNLYVMKETIIHLRQMIENLTDQKQQSCPLLNFSSLGRFLKTFEEFLCSLELDTNILPSQKIFSVIQISSSELLLDLITILDRKQVKIMEVEKLISGIKLSIEKFESLGETAKDVIDSLKMLLVEIEHFNSVDKNETKIEPKPEVIEGKESSIDKGVEKQLQEEVGTDKIKIEPKPEVIEGKESSINKGVEKLLQEEVGTDKTKIEPKPEVIGEKESSIDKGVEKLLQEEVGTDKSRIEPKPEVIEGKESSIDEGVEKLLQEEVGTDKKKIEPKPEVIEGKEPSIDKGVEKLLQEEVGTDKMKIETKPEVIGGRSLLLIREWKNYFRKKLVQIRRE
ncbi:hypothetical protein WA026_018455 [Henosepilachna vigintioctopunctata]|uniref:Uncharacterized protein n=1 Tax=Henosepilachna vigintioctopunctata TaxID=420089 RepID=A0AAW1V3D7_9CUCU